jgi:hypothetical protein
MPNLSIQEIWKLTGKYARRQNEPLKEAICINNAGNGDDKDYSRFIGMVALELCKTMRWELGWRLYLTDPTLMAYIEYEDFKIEMADRIKREALEEVDGY